MKLVDILARELKVWPEGANTLSQSRAGMVYFVPPKSPVKELFRTHKCEDWKLSEVTQSQWQAAVDALKAGPSVKTKVALEEARVIRGEKVVEWTGEGLPPVGTICECHLPGELTNNYSWVEAKVIWHNGPTECAVVRSTSKLAWCDEFRPIRTPEQIAAEEREKNAIAMCRATQGAHDWMEAFRMLHDAGYRKFEIVDN